jgi:lysophospholipase L1-like esterase
MAIAQSLLATVAMLAFAAAFPFSGAEAGAQSTSSVVCPADGASDPGAGAPTAKPARQPGDWAWLCRYREENRLLASGDAPLVVFIGDSITEGWAASDTQNFDKQWAGRGIGGQTSAQVLLRFYQDAIGLKPKVIHLLVGGNDVARNAGALDATAFKDNVRAMADLACANNITLVLGTILPAKQYYWRKEIEPVEEIRTLNRWLAEFAAIHRIRLVDYYAPMATPQGAMRAELTDDGVHPNQQGYQVMRQALETALTDALADDEGPQQSACTSRNRAPRADSDG